MIGAYEQRVQAVRTRSLPSVQECVWKLCAIALGTEILKRFGKENKRNEREIPGISFKFFLIFFTKRCKSINLLLNTLPGWLAGIACSLLRQLCVFCMCISFVLFKPSIFFFFFHFSFHFVVFPL